ncbi:unnamed protein product [Penicillium discolor]
MGSPLQNLGDIDLNFNFDIEDDLFGFNISGEGLDFIPFTPVELIPDFQDAETPNLSFTEHRNVAVEAQPDSDTPITIDKKNSRLIQHYLDVMKGFAKLDEFPHKASNLFVSAFSKSLQFPPLFYAILAFSASHLSVEDDSYSNQATKYSQLAESSFKTHIQGEDTEVEALLSALLVRIKTVHMMGGDVQIFHSLMQTAADIVSSQGGAKALEDPSSLSRRIIIRLAILDARSTCFRLGGGVLVKRLYASSSCSFIFERESQDASRTTLLNLLQADLLKVRVASLDLRLHDQPESDSIQSPVSIMEINDLYEEIRREIDIFEERMVALGDDLTSSPLSGDKTIDSASYNRLIVLSTLHSGLLYLIMIIPFPLVGCEKSVSAILLNQLKVSRDPSRRSSPGSLMPASLFLAGVHNTDPIKSDWILGLLEKGIKWGPYIGKTRVLLEAVLQMHSKGMKVALRDVMDEVTGRIVI